MQWSCVCPLLGLDLPRRGWSSPSYRDHLDSLQYQHILQNATVPSVRILYPNGIIIYSKTTPFMILVWFKNGYCGRPTLNSLTGHRERLILTPSRICGVRWKRQCRKPGLSSLPEIVMSYGPLCQARGMKLLHLRITFDQWLSPWCNGWNHRSKRKGSGLLIKEVNFWKRPF